MSIQDQKTSIDSVQNDQLAIAAVRQEALPQRQDSSDHDQLLAEIGDARVVLIGDGTHGTHEFYRERAELTKRLITEKGFNAVTIEADWPDAYRVNRFVRGSSSDRDPVEALAGFTPFPAWMWRNAVVANFVGWLREFNSAQAAHMMTGFYGLDLHGQSTSGQAVLSYLEGIDAVAARRARVRYAAFDTFSEELLARGRGAEVVLSQSQEALVVRELVNLRRQAVEMPGAAPLVEDEPFFAQQNARVMAGAEGYYREMFRGRTSSWNLRERQMFDALTNLMQHLDRDGGQSKVVVWAHNAHVGNARATAAARAGELNLGQLVRDHFGDQAFSIGTTGYTGTVTAASVWNGSVERQTVRPAQPHSYEAILHAVGFPQFLMLLRASTKAVRHLRVARSERAIGAVYRPETERASHYFEVSLPEQFDAIIYVDDTRAVVPLDQTTSWHAGESAPMLSSP